MKVSRKVLFAVCSQNSPAEQSEHSSRADREGIGPVQKSTLRRALVEHGGRMEGLDGSRKGGVDLSDFLEMSRGLLVYLKNVTSLAGKITCLAQKLLLCNILGLASFSCCSPQL